MRGADGASQGSGKPTLPTATGVFGLLSVPPMADGSRSWKWSERAKHPAKFTWTRSRAVQGCATRGPIKGNGALVSASGCITFTRALSLPQELCPAVVGGAGWVRTWRDVRVAATSSYRRALVFHLGYIK